MMVKAILELPEMPENCKECSLHSWRSNGYTTREEAEKAIGGKEDV